MTSLIHHCGLTSSNEAAQVIWKDDSLKVYKKTANQDVRQSSSSICLGVVLIRKQAPPLAITPRFAENNS